MELNKCRSCGQFIHRTRKLCPQCMKKYSWDRKYKFFRLKPYKRVSKLQKKAFLAIRDFFKLPTMQEVIFSWLPYKRYDIVIEDKKLIFEIDGKQHFKQVKMMHKTKKEFEEYQRNDKFKERMAHANGYQVIRIPYDVEVNKEFLQELFKE